MYACLHFVIYGIMVSVILVCGPVARAENVLAYVSLCCCGIRAKCWCLCSAYGVIIICGSLLLIVVCQPLLKTYLRLPGTCLH